MSESSKASVHDAQAKMLEARKQRQREQQLAHEQQLRTRDAQRNREKRLEELGLRRYLEQVAILRQMGELTPAAAEREEEWAREHAKSVEESSAEVAEVNALFQEWQAEAERTLVGAATVFDERGDALERVSDLRHLASVVGAGQAVRRSSVDDDSRFYRWLRERSSTGLAAATSTWPESYVDGPRHWFVVTDTETVVPIGLRAAQLEQWCHDWRDRVQGLRGAELVVYARPGEHPTFVGWSGDDPWSLSQVSAWCRRLAPPSGDQDPRFDCQRGSAWTAPCAPIYLPASTAAVSALPSAVELAAGASPHSRLVTGIDSFDRAFRGGVGVPFGTRLLLCGDPQNCKTQLLLELAEAARRCGWHVLWLSVDDEPNLITVRRLQRLGLAAERAGALLPDDVAQLDPAVSVVNDRSLEAAWEAAHARAAAEGAKLLVLADSIQSGGLTAAADGRQDRAAIEAAIGAVIECQRRWPATFAATSEITANGQPKGSRDLEYKFDVVLALRLTGRDLRASLKKNKPGRLGVVELVVDFDGQRLLSPQAAAEEEADALAWQQLRAVLAGGGSKSQNALEAELKALGVSRADVRRSLARHIGLGDLLQSKAGYRLP